MKRTLHKSRGLKKARKLTPGSVASGTGVPAMPVRQSHPGPAEKSSPKPYRNRGGDAGIVAYDYGPDWIQLWYVRGGSYTYPANLIGAANLRAMKRLAEVGDGLTSFVNTHPEVKNGFLR
jgi:hypothetical protein